MGHPIQITQYAGAQISGPHLFLEPIDMIKDILPSDDFRGEILGLPPGKTEMITFIWDDIPLHFANGDHFATMELIEATFLRAPATKGGYVCHRVMNWALTKHDPCWSTVYLDNPAAAFDLDVKTSTHDEIYPWHFSHHYGCGPSHGRLCSGHFCPDAFDYVDDARLWVYGSLWYGVFPRGWE